MQALQVEIEYVRNQVEELKKIIIEGFDKLSIVRIENLRESVSEYGDASTTTTPKGLPLNESTRSNDVRRTLREKLEMWELRKLAEEIEFDEKISESLTQ